MRIRSALAYPLVVVALATGGDAAAFLDHLVDRLEHGGQGGSSETARGG